MTIAAPKDNKERSLCSQDNIDDQITAAIHEAVAVAGQTHHSLSKETINSEIRGVIRAAKGTLPLQKLAKEIEWSNPLLGKQHTYGPLRHYLRRKIHLFGINSNTNVYEKEFSLTMRSRKRKRTAT